MDRLQQHHQRLYQPARADDGRVRVLVLGATGPAGWPALAQAWRGVQAELELPAPGIAISGTDACQLWFSLAEPVPAQRAREFLAAVRTRWLGELPEARVRQWPAQDGADAPAPEVPPRACGPERWSAFVAPDLAGLFADEPWLDHPPGTDAQADLLSRLAPAGAAAFEAACLALGVGVPAGALVTVDDTPQQTLAPAGPPPGGSPAAQATAFLLAVMRDPSAELALRIDAAKALLGRG